MRLLFKQRFTFGFDSYDIYNEQGDTVFTIKSRFSFGRKLEIYDRGGNHVGTLTGKVFCFRPTYEMYIEERFVGTIQKKFTFFKPEFEVDCNGWTVNGSWWEFDYSIIDQRNTQIANIQKEFGWTDTYVLDIYNDANALAVLMIVIAIDVEKDDRNN